MLHARWGSFLNHHLLQSAAALKYSTSNHVMTVVGILRIWARRERVTLMYSAHRKYKDTIETLTLHKNTEDMIMKSCSNEREEKKCTEAAIGFIV